jgi:hypothetical protein
MHRGDHLIIDKAEATGLQFLKWGHVFIEAECKKEIQRLLNSAASQKMHAK